jgi:hypothetical protein
VKSPVELVRGAVGVTEAAMGQPAGVRDSSKEVARKILGSPWEQVAKDGETG